MTKIIVIGTAVFLCASSASGADEICTKETVNIRACVAGELMVCNKEFNPKIKDLVYEWHAINDNGQPFEIYLNKDYKKVHGYTPAKCSDAKLEQKAIPPKVVK